MTIKLGAHLSIAGGFSKTLYSLKDKGGNCLQIFSTSPRSWNFAKVDEESVNKFVKVKKDLKIEPVYFHASYLLNLADLGRVGQFSINFLISELNLAARLGVRGSIVHLGSYKDDKTEEKSKKLIASIKEILEKTPSSTVFIIENAGNRKIGQTVEEIGEIIKETGGNDRLKVCLDTCHLHAVGYDLSAREKLDSFLLNFDKLIGLSRLELIHANDSKDDFGSLRDRHENIGQGKINIEVFRNLLTHPKTEKLPFIIETPGFENKGPDKKNLDILKSLLRR